jgi:hypothetical protein
MSLWFCAGLGAWPSEGALLSPSPMTTTGLAVRESVGAEPTAANSTVAGLAETDGASATSTRSGLVDSTTVAAAAGVTAAGPSVVDAVAAGTDAASAAAAGSAAGAWAAKAAAALADAERLVAARRDAGLARFAAGCSATGGWLSCSTLLFGAGAASVTCAPSGACPTAGAFVAWPVEYSSRASSFIRYLPFHGPHSSRVPRD